MSKELKKAYDKKMDRLALHLNDEERAILEKMRLSEEWENIAGFIKFKLFGNDTTVAYDKMLNSRKKEDTYIVMKTLMDTMNRNLEYLHYKVNYEADKFKNEHADYEKKLAGKAAKALENYNRNTGTNVKFNIDDLVSTIIRLDRIDITKNINMLTSWLDTWKKKTDKMFHDCQVILRSIDIAIEKEEIDRMRLLTDEELEPFGHDFNDTNSPEAREYARRASERARKLHGLD